MYKKSFIDDCLSGDAVVSDLESYVRYWHIDCDIDMSLQEFLGMTDYEFEQWGKASDDFIRDILKKRKQH